MKPYKRYFPEDLTLPIEAGDTILMGKWKNKKGVVKSFGKDENNQPTAILDNGKEIPLLKVRIQKLMPKKKEK